MAPATAMSQPPAVRPVPPSTPPLESLCVRERARVALRECHALVTQFFHAIDGLLSGRANTGSTLRAEELMEKVLERQVELRKLIDEGQLRVCSKCYTKRSTNAIVQSSNTSA